MSNLLSRFLDWLEKTLPLLLAAFGFGHKLGSKEAEDLKKQLIKAEYELEKKKNESRILLETLDKPDQHIIDEFFTVESNGPNRDN